MSKNSPYGGLPNAFGAPSRLVPSQSTELARIEALVERGDAAAAAREAENSDPGSNALNLAIERSERSAS